MEDDGGIVSKDKPGMHDRKGFAFPTGYDVSRRDGDDDSGDHIEGSAVLCETSASASLDGQESIDLKKNVFVFVY